MRLCRTGHFEFCVAVDDVLTLVALVFTAADSHFELGAAILEVELQGDERAALLLLGLAHLGDFVHMGEELAAPSREMVETVREKVFVDVRTHEPDFILALVDVDPRFAQGALAIAYRLDFRTDEHDTYFEGFVYEVEMVCLAVYDDRSALFLFRHSLSLLLASGGFDAGRLALCDFLAGTIDAGGSAAEFLAFPADLFLLGMRNGVVQSLHQFLASIAVHG